MLPAVKRPWEVAVCLHVRAWKIQIQKNKARRLAAAHDSVSDTRKRATGHTRRELRQTTSGAAGGGGRAGAAGDAAADRARASSLLDGDPPPKDDARLTPLVNRRLAAEGLFATA